MMRLSECYTAPQGEGPRVGTATIFTRFGGCNLRCAGWPCDTPYAIDPKLYRDEWEKLDWADVAVRINQQNQKYGATNVCFTGGEPFLQPKGDLERLIKALYKMDYSIEFFTNGTIEFTPWAVHVCQFTMDWKLPGSGEDYKNEVRIENLHKINKVDRENAVKFVVKDLEDFDLALSLYKRYVRDNYPYIIPYAGVAWGHLEPAELWEWNKQAKTPFRLNVQVHNYVFDRTQRGI